MRLSLSPTTTRRIPRARDGDTHSASAGTACGSPTTMARWGRSATPAVRQWPRDGSNSWCWWNSWAALDRNRPRPGCTRMRAFSIARFRAPACAPRRSPCSLHRARWASRTSRSRRSRRHAVARGNRHRSRWMRRSETRRRSSGRLASFSTISPAAERGCTTMRSRSTFRRTAPAGARNADPRMPEKPRYTSSSLVPSHFTFSGSRWSKKLLVPVSNVAMAAMSSVLRSKSSTLKFSTMRSLRTDLDRTTMSRCDSPQGWILEDMIPPLRKWGPCFRLNPIGLQELLGLTLLQERIHFDLVDGWGHLVVQHEVHDTVRMKVGDANRPDFARAVQVLHRAPLAIHVAKWLMNEIQVHIVQLQALQGPLKRCQRAFIAVLLNPQFRGDKQLFSGDSAPLDPATNGGFVEIGRGRVDQAITRGNGVDHALFTCCRIGDLEHAKAEQGHCDAIVQCYLLHEPLPVPGRVPPMP